MAATDRTIARDQRPVERAAVLSRRPWTAVLTVLLLLAAAAWLLSPGAFAQWRGSESMELLAPLSPDDSVLLPLPPSSRTVTVLKAEARVQADGEASVVVVVCDGGNPVAGITTARADGTVGGCAGARPAAGERVEPPSTLAVLVRHGAATDVVVDGVDVLYRDGVRLGYQRTGERFHARYQPLP